MSMGHSKFEEATATLNVGDKGKIGEPYFSRTLRVIHDDRTRRILDSKLRTFGVDLEFLKSQVEEKKLRAQDEAELARAYDEMALYIDQKLMVMEAERRDIVKAMDDETAQFWNDNQGKASRREWDLSDPNGIKHELPARVGDEDPRNGPSSLQKFDGEDLWAGERKKLQLAQQAAWCAAQMQEKAAKAADESARDVFLYHLALEQAALSNAILGEVAAARKAMLAESAAANRGLAAEKKAREAAGRAYETAANEHEMAATLNSAFMTEDPNCQVSAVDPNRYRKDHYKGISAEEAARVREYQAMQADELRARKEAEALTELDYARQQEMYRKASLISAAAQEDIRAELRASVAAEHARQRKEKADRDAYFKQLYTNRPTGEYFDQWGRIHR